MYSREYMSIPISQFIPLLPPGNRRFVFYICDSISVLYISSFVPFFLDSTYKQYHDIVFFSLIYFTQYGNLYLPGIFKQAFCVFINTLC